MRGARRMRRIVAAVDFSEGSTVALGRLRTLPRGGSVALHLVHVVAVPTLTPLPMARELAGRELRKLMIQARRRFARARVTSEISSGRPADEIVRIARIRKADVIVAGRRGAGGFPRLLLGSTAERLVRLSPIPVLLVSRQSTAYKRVLMPLDVTENVTPRQIIPRVIRARRPDLVMIGNHGRTALGRALIGNAAREVLASTTCDLFLVPIP